MNSKTANELMAAFVDSTEQRLKQLEDDAVVFRSRVENAFKEMGFDFSKARATIAQTRLKPQAVNNAKHLGMTVDPIDWSEVAGEAELVPDPGASDINRSEIYARFYPEEFESDYLNHIVTEAKNEEVG